IDFNPLELPDFAENPPNRCYNCKRALFAKLREIASENGYDHLADGANLDDAKDFRPGAKATLELGILSPLKDAGFKKDEVRSLSQTLGLSTWDKPQGACLASRIPYGTVITEATLKKVEKAEEFLRNEGFTQIRVRAMGGAAIIEVAAEERSRFFSLKFMDKVYDEMRALGFLQPSLDLGGYRTGALNDALDENEKSKHQ
ncbi:MAG: ATP-dependent sacrificial sulfur transferase LarE, partial [Candidatus Adiutrix sp.]